MGVVLGRTGVNPPAGAVIYYLLREPATVTLQVRSRSGGVVATLPAPGGRGLHRVVWDLRAAAGKAFVPVLPGEYQLRLRAGATTRERTLKVLAGR